MTDQPVRWWEAYPERLRLELEAMADVAPALEWTTDLERSTGGGWKGECPVWPFERPEPPGLGEFLAGRRFKIAVWLSAAHPVITPGVTPLDPIPDIAVRTFHEWHLLGDGDLCLLRDALTWTGVEPAAELVRKAAAWFLEYLLITAEMIGAMTDAGIVNDDSLDHLFVPGAGPT